MYECTRTGHFLEIEEGAPMAMNRVRQERKDEQMETDSVTMYRRNVPIAMQIQEAASLVEEIHKFHGTH